MGDYKVELSRVIFFEEKHALVDPVQTVGLGCRAVVRANCEVYVGKTAFEFAHGVERGLVVGISADEEVVVVVIDGGDIVLDHAANDGVLAPERDEDGDAPFVERLGWQGRRFTASPIPCADGVQGKVIEAARQDEQGGWEQAGGDPGVERVQTRFDCGDH